jgi:two-component system KDP operon response regulator KdpE
MPSVLIVEDDAPIRRFLRISLEANGFDVSESRLGEDALRQCVDDTFDVVILDLGLPDVDGIDVLRRVREWSAVPIIVLTALDEGANDYVTKPFSITELMARLRVMLRTASKRDDDQAEFECGDLKVDLVRRRIYQAGRELRISRKEYELLRLLVTHAGQVLTHQQILREIWGPSHVSDIHYLRVLVGNLRQRLGDDPSKPHYIHTIQGVGYRLSD